MATLERFEDLDAWKKARELTKSIYQVTSAGEFARDFGLRDQIRRAAVSVISNIAEGFERDGSKEFLRFSPRLKDLVVRSVPNSMSPLTKHISLTLSSMD
jgi:23S rRNA-intervening sequence protein